MGTALHLLLQVVDDGDTAGDTALFGVTDTVEGRARRYHNHPAIVIRSGRAVTLSGRFKTLGARVWQLSLSIGR